LAGMLRPPGHSQRQILYRTEKSLLADDPSLGSLFAIFTRLTRQDAMPASEQTVPMRRHSRKLVIATALIALIAVLSGVAFISLAPSPHRCGAPSTSVQRQSVTQGTSCLPGPALVRGRQ